MFKDYVFRFTQYLAHDGQYAFVTPAYNDGKVFLIVFKRGKLKDYECWIAAVRDVFIWPRYQGFEIPVSIKKKVWSIMDEELDLKSKRRSIRNIFIYL